MKTELERLDRVCEGLVRDYYTELMGDENGAECLSDWDALGAALKGAEAYSEGIWTAQFAGHRSMTVAFHVLDELRTHQRRLIAA